MLSSNIATVMFGILSLDSMLCVFYVCKPADKSLLRAYTTLSQTLLLVSYADRPEIDSRNTSYTLLLVSSAGGHVDACGNQQCIYLVANSKTD